MLSINAFIITAVDTACRFGELLKLRWRDIDFANDVIAIIAFNTKTAEAREVGMRDRVRQQLLTLQDLAPTDPDVLVFGILSSIKRSWKTAGRLAGIEDFRFHDLRHTAITRLVVTGLPSAEIMRISGHKQSNTFLRYVNPKADSLRRAVAMLSEYNRELQNRREHSMGFMR